MTVHGAAWGSKPAQIEVAGQNDIATAESNSVNVKMQPFDAIGLNPEMLIGRDQPRAA